MQISEGYRGLLDEGIINYMQNSLDILTEFEHVIYLVLVLKTPVILLRLTYFLILLLFHKRTVRNPNRP